MPVTPEDQLRHPDERDAFVPVRHMALKLLIMPALWPFAAYFVFRVPVAYVMFFGFFLFVPPTMFVLLSKLMNRRPERYFIRFALLLEVIVGIVSIAMATRLG
jgi:hypothetical protein